MQWLIQSRLYINVVPEVPTTRYNTSHFGRWKSPYQGLDVFRMQDDIICCVWETGIRPFSKLFVVSVAVQGCSHWV